MDISLVDLPNEIIHIIFGYLAEIDMLNVGFVFPKLAWYEGDRIGK